ncbi:cysteine hydrolase [Nonomuraea sp. NPDC048901]|uniref:cysteine hydrolase family protein n=1 Tax=Nonomuraea sp. NPDC048901 TaxID=3155627 RepID=UPI0033C8D77F
MGGHRTWRLRDSGAGEASSILSHSLARTRAASCCVSSTGTLHYLCGGARQTRHVFRPGLIDMPARSAKLWPRDPEPLVRGSWDADIIDELAPVEGDHVIDKNRYDAFLYTDLEVLLRGLGIKRLLVAGILTNVCVETTVRSADQRGFDPYVASDCTTAYGEARDPALAAMSVVFATVGKWRELFDLVGEE